MPSGNLKASELGIDLVVGTVRIKHRLGDRQRFIFQPRWNQQQIGGDGNFVVVVIREGHHRLTCGLHIVLGQRQNAGVTLGNARLLWPERMRRAAQCHRIRTNEAARKCVIEHA